MKIVVSMEIRDGRAQASSLELLTAARSLAGETGTVVAMIIGQLKKNNIAADKIVSFDGDGNQLVTADHYSAALLQTAADEKPDVVLCSYSALGLDVGPHLAAKTNWPLVAYCTEIATRNSTLTAKSQLYGGKVVATTSVGKPAIFIVNPGSYSESSPSSSTVPVTKCASPASWGKSRVKLVEEIRPDASAVDISKASRIVCVGRGIGEKDSIHLIGELAAALNAEIAGSRPVVDSGWLPKERQVGKSGRKVQPKLYIAIGVSGAPEHLEGMKKSDLIIAINLDPKAPIFNVSHYGSTCDLFDLVPALTSRLMSSGS